MRIPFNKPYLTGRETEYMLDAVRLGKLSGNGAYTQACQAFLTERYGFGATLLTTSGTDALEMAALLLRIGPGDEVIVPSYTFVSTANAFVLRGATIVFADSSPEHPNVDPAHVRTLLTERTRAIVLVHYAGVACDLDAFADLARGTGVALVEDAAQAIDATYRGRPLGTFGALAAFSFHETKNVISGEGGALAVNAAEHAERAEVIWEKGTNRSAFFRGEVDKYGWVDVGSSFLPSEATAAFLYAQLEHIDAIQARRSALYRRYATALASVAAESGAFTLPYVPDYAGHNAHTFYLVCRDGTTRDGLLAHLKTHGILAVSHYISLHSSAFARQRSPEPPPHLPQADRYTERLLRLPLFHELREADVDEICGRVADYVR